MNENERLPKYLTPVNILAYLYNAFGHCGCSETSEMVKSIISILEWADSKHEVKYDSIYEEVGVFYIIAGRLDRLGLIEHGVSIRFPWLTDDGKRLLAAMKLHGPKTIEDATGEAYDECTY